MLAVALAIVLLGDVWLLLNSGHRRTPPPPEEPRVRAQRLLGEARAKSKGGVGPDEVLPLLGQAIDASPTLAEARLMRIELSLAVWLERWAVLDASPLLESARIPSEPTIERLRTTMLSDAAALGATTVSEEARAEVAAIEALLTRKPVESGSSARVRVLRAWQQIRRGEAQAALKECDVAEPATDTLSQWTLARCLLAVGREDPGHDALADRARAILETLPPSAAVLLDLAEADTGSAPSILERALAASPGEPAILARLAEAEERAGNFVQALAWACQANDAVPNVAGLLLLRARLHARLGQVGPAREVYDHARRWFPDRADVLRARALFLLKTGDADKALGDAERAAQIEPSNASFTVVCEALTATGQADMARRRKDVWEHASPRARERANFAIYLRESMGGIPSSEGDHWALALAAFLKGDLPTTEMMVEKIDDPDGWELLARVRVAQGRASDALDLLRKTLATDPLRASAQAFLGRALLDLGKRDEAAEALARALEIDATCAEAWRGQAELELAQGEIQEALKALDQAIEHDASDLEVLALRSDLKRRVRDYEGALADVDSALSHWPHEARWLLLRAEVKLALNDAPGARADAEAVAAAQRDSAAAWSLVARAAVAQGDLEAAEKALERTFALDARDAAARVANARLALARGHRDAALSELGRTLDADPDEADALYLRAKLAMEDARWQEAVNDLVRFLDKHSADPRNVEAAGWLDLARKALRQR